MENRILSGFAGGLFISLIFLSCSQNIEDRSLSIKEYYELGVPDIGEDWNYIDLNTCVDVLGQLKEKNFFSLPVKNSDKSGMLYQKIMNYDHSDDFQFNQQGLENFIELYDDKNMRSSPMYYHVEYAGALRSFLLSVNKYSKDYLQRLDTFDIERKRSFEKWEKSQANILSAYMFYQNDSIAFSDEDLIYLSSTLIPIIKFNWKYFSDESKEKLVSEFENIELNNHSIFIRWKYKKMNAELRRNP
ncbi:hypothetical protein [Marinigracilibium pacificum]|uniref:Lipoprotein n=1 Tax=Marinigracilibium pacificum TaxID=2729599 RepID=A0A848J0N3_9BACT|nr:hypothetical protein [Marinigracilibium pacificum]NMM47839.1 hypothetical protein [Marinigracilibium pacificum]